MIDYLVIAILAGVIIMLVVDRFFIVEQHQKDKDKLLEELSRAVKAVISKNANEYVMTTSIDKVAPEERKVVSPDEIPEESVSDDDFFKAVSKGLQNSPK